MTVVHRRFDVLVIGAGGGGLRAALQLASQEARVAVVSKVFPTRSHTVAAQGGVNAALANVTPDNWQWHLYDTVKGSDWLGDQDAIEYMCRTAAERVIELEHYGVPFSRLDDGRIYQRPFGGQSQHFGGAQAARTCAAADRTGHAILHTLYQQNIRCRTTFFDEYFALDLIQDEEGHVLGAVTLESATGDVVVIEARATLLATGGAGQLYRTNTNARINTGDGLAMALRAGLPLQDMEFFQFHPTGIAGKGMLISEAVRGEGGYLVNGDGERFMSRYAPKAHDLASRDVVSRAIYTEVQEGRGCGTERDHVQLHISHLGEAAIAERLPGIREMCQTFLGIDPAASPIPVYPTAHYMMGGIPTSRDARVVVPAGSGEEAVPGLWAAGECACVSVHGANRLGGNSLLDIIVFGRAAADDIERWLQEAPYHRPLPEAAVARSLQRLEALEQDDDGERPAELRKAIQATMEQYCGVFRTEAKLQEGLAQVQALAQRSLKLRLSDRSRIFNIERIEALETQNLAALACATVASALARTESRGAHSRVDHPERDDAQWLRHTLYFHQPARLEYKPVKLRPLTAEPIPPVERIY